VVRKWTVPCTLGNTVIKTGLGGRVCVCVYCVHSGSGRLLRTQELTFGFWKMECHGFKVLSAVDVKSTVF
jgi:hypothetical protein